MLGNRGLAWESSEHLKERETSQNWCRPSWFHAATFYREERSKGRSREEAWETAGLLAKQNLLLCLPTTWQSPGEQRPKGCLFQGTPSSTRTMVWSCSAWLCIQSYSDGKGEPQGNRPWEMRAGTGSCLSHPAGCSASMRFCPHPPPHLLFLNQDTHFHLFPSSFALSLLKKSCATW